MVGSGRTTASLVAGLLAVGALTSCRWSGGDADVTPGPGPEQVGTRGTGLEARPEATVIARRVEGAAVTASDAPPNTPEEAFSRLSLFHGERGMALAAGFPLDLVFEQIPGQWPPPEVNQRFEAEYAMETALDPGWARRLRIAKTFLFGSRTARVELMRDEWGLQTLDGPLRPVGLLHVDPPVHDVEGGQDLDLLVMGCASCHFGRAAGRNYPGLGNKNIDVYRLAADVALASELLTELRDLGRIVGLPRKSPKLDELDARANAFAKRLSDPRWSNLTQGLVPTSHIFWWFYDQESRRPPDQRTCVKQAGPVELPSDAPRGQVRVPHLWGFEARRGALANGAYAVGLFADAYGVGPGWPGGAELGADPAHATLADPSYVRQMDALVEAIVAAARPPAYPFAIDAGLAATGKALFEKKRADGGYGCSGCHGTYRRDGGEPVYLAPKVIPYDARGVGTDRSRLAMTTDGKHAATYNCLVDAVDLRDPRPELGGAQRLARDRDATVGYVAPRLEGIWARYPYLHNGSVPTVRMLLTRPELRPEVFSVQDAGEVEMFDAVDLGLVVKRPTPEVLAGLEAGRRSRTLGCEEPFSCPDPDPDHRRWYWTERPEHANTGHYFWSDVPRADQDALIEYLKTL